jgi:hypothetical protein
VLSSSSRVPSFSPREMIRGHQASHPALCRWAALLPRQGGGRTIEAFDDKFFSWWVRQIPAIEDYPYVGINFSRDPEMLVPPGEERGEMGKFFFCFRKLFNFYVFSYISIFFCVPEYLTTMYLFYADVGPVHPMDFSRTR